MSNCGKIYEKAMEEILSNITEWYQGAKYRNKYFENDGEGFVSDTECIVYNSLDKIRK